MCARSGWSPGSAPRQAGVHGVGVGGVLRPAAEGGSADGPRRGRRVLGAGERVDDEGPYPG